MSLQRSPAALPGWHLVRSDPPQSNLRCERQLMQARSGSRLHRGLGQPSQLCSSRPSTLALRARWLKETPGTPASATDQIAGLATTKRISASLVCISGQRANASHGAAMEKDASHRKRIRVIFWTRITARIRRSWISNAERLGASLSKVSRRRMQVLSC